MSDRRYDAFVSAVSSECGRARDAAAAELRRAGQRVAVQSDFAHGPASATLLQMLHDTIRDCTDVHCIVGTRCGTCPPAAATAAFQEFLPQDVTEASYTQWEFHFARHYAPDRTWLYLAAEGYPPDEPVPAGAERPKMQLQFLEYLRKQGCDYVRFANIGELRAEVLARGVPGRTDIPRTRSTPARTNRCNVASPPMPSAASSLASCWHWRAA